MTLAAILVVGLPVNLALSLASSVHVRENKVDSQELLRVNANKSLPSDAEMGSGRIFGGGSECPCTGNRNKRNDHDSLAGSNEPNGVSGRVVGGHTTREGQYPYMALIFLDGAQQCGGTIINEECILTAAHCVFGNPEPIRYTVMAGAFDIRRPEPGRVVYPVSEVHYHPNFDPDTYENDIAIIRMAKPLSFGRNIQPVCLSAAMKKYDDSHAYVVGWGKISEHGPPSPVQKKVDLPVLSNAKCESMFSYRYRVFPSMLCAGYAQGGEDACTGDSGGPLCSAADDKQIGIVSFGEGCARRSSPGMYTRIGSFMDYILTHSRVERGCTARVAW